MCTVHSTQSTVSAVTERMKKKDIQKEKQERRKGKGKDRKTEIDVLTLTKKTSLLPSWRSGALFRIPVALPPCPTHPHPSPRPSVCSVQSDLAFVGVSWLAVAISGASQNISPCCPAVLPPSLVLVLFV